MESSLYYSRIIDKIAKNNSNLETLEIQESQFEKHSTKAAKDLDKLISNDKLPKKLKYCNYGTITELLGIVRLYSDYTYVHCVHVGTLAYKIANDLDLSESTVLDTTVAGLLHDTGKIYIPLSILDKPAKLTQEEYSIMKLHPVLGYRTLSKTGKFNSSIMSAVKHHHERLDGNGYPDNLDEYKVDISSKIISVADVYDALVSDRPYKKGMPKTKAKNYIKTNCGSAFSYVAADSLK